MGFLHRMTADTAGIALTAPVQWRSYDAMCGVLWEAEGQAGATGYYKSPDPRVLLFFNDVSEHIGVSEHGAVGGPFDRPLLRAIYIPSGQPIWTRFHSGHRFSHLDLHLKRSWLIERLSPMLGEAEATAAVMRPTEMQDVSDIAPLGEALRREVCTASRHPIYAECLAVALVAGLLDLPRQDAAQAYPSGGLTPVQMRRLHQLLDRCGGNRLSNAEMAEEVGLSPGWFARAFKKTNGLNPLEWQREQRIERVKEMLQQGDVMIADLSSQFGFADQAHLTRVFRQVTGTTPAVWAREHRRR